MFYLVLSGFFHFLTLFLFHLPAVHFSSFTCSTVTGSDHVSWPQGEPIEEKQKNKNCFAHAKKKKHKYGSAAAGKVAHSLSHAAASPFVNANEEEEEERGEGRLSSWRQL